MNFDFLLPRRSVVELNSALSEIEEAQLVYRLAGEELSYWFKHALVQDSAYSTLMKLQRKHLHKLVAETLERTYPDRLDEHAVQLAHHFAGAEDDAKTFEYALRAADFAVRQYGYAEARVYYAQALEVLTRFPDSAENRRLYVDTFLKQLRVTRLAVDPRENLARLEQAKTLTRSLQVPEAAREDRLRLARVHYWSGIIHSMRTALVEASNELERALDLARELDDDGLLIRATSALAGVIILSGQNDKAVPLLTRLLEHYEMTDNRLEWVYALARLGYVHAAQGDLALGLAEGERAVAHARELNNPTRLVEVMGTVTGIYYHGGDLEKFLAASKETLDAAEQSGDRVYAMYYVQKALAESRLGNTDAALEHLRRDKAKNLRWTEQRFFDDWLAGAEAEIVLNAGHVEQAVALAKQAVEFSSGAGGLFGGGFSERVWGQALARLEPPRYAEADTHFAESLRLLEKGQIRLEAARTRVAWGHVLQARGDAIGAREQFAQAHAQFQTSGLTREAQALRVLLNVREARP